MSGKERIRLLLLDHPPTRSETFRAYSSWPISIFSTVWCTSLLVIAVIFFGFTALAITLHRDGLTEYVDRPVLLPDLDSRSVRLRLSREGHGDEIVSQAMSIPAFSNPTNIYFLSSRNLDKEASCSLESFLRKTNQNVFFLHFGSTRQHEFENTLKAAYPQLTVSKLEEKQFIRESLFEEIFSRQPPSLSIARNYLLWQYAGTVITKNLIVSTDTLPSVSNGTCLIGPGFISCPMACSSFVYQLILNTFNNHYNDDDRVVRETVEDFCDSSINCPGAQRLKNICNQPGDNCDFILMDNWELNDADLVGMVKFCPLTYRFSRQSEALHAEGASVLKAVKGLIGGSKVAATEGSTTTKKK